MYEPIEWLIDNIDNTNIDVKVMYFSLEISKESKILAAIAYKLFKEYKIVISPQNLQSLFNNYILNEDILELIKGEKFQQWFKFFEEKVEFHDEVRHGYGIYNTVKTYAENNGKYKYKEIDWQNEDGKSVKRKVKDYYIPNNSNEYVIIIVDHASLIMPSKGQSLHQAMGELSNQYLMAMRDKWSYIPVLIQQQSAASEKQDFTFKGDIIMEKLRPSAEGLADNKTIGRDVDLMLGLFWPNRYGIESYNGWNLNRIGDNHRELIILLNRHGMSNASIDLYFNGACNYFKELPKIPEEQVYNFIEKNK